MTASPADTVRPVPLEGRLEGIAIPELLWELNRVQHTGALLVERGAVRKALYFRRGRIVFAASTDADDRLGPFLFRRGEVELAPLIAAGLDVMRGRRLGQVLVERGIMQPAALVRAVLDHVREIALSVFPWSSGTWRLTRACLPADESITLDLATEEVVLAGVRRVRDGVRVRRAVGGPRAVYELATDRDFDVPGLGMTERAILDELQRPARVDRLCAEIFAPSEVVFRSLWALAILGLVRRIPGKPAANVGVLAGGGVEEGWIDERGGVAEMLLQLGDARFTGALRLYRGGQEAVLFLRGGALEFARTSDAELSLAAHLLRRGVISDRDRDEAARRLPTGKRIGTLLAEQGALDFQDLKRFVREQVMEVVKRLVLWHEGEYEVHEGETVEEQIVVGRSAEDVVLAAYESLENCERIWRELGTLETVYRLKTDYLDRLDRMTLRPAVWELVSALSEPRSVRELLAARPEPDFEVCRWLCGLRRVRVVEQASVGADGVSPDELLTGPAPRPPIALAVAGPDELEPTTLAAVDAAVVTGSTAAQMAPELFAARAAEARSATAAAVALEEPGDAREGEPDEDPLGVAAQVTADEVVLPRALVAPASLTEPDAVVEPIAVALPDGDEPVLAAWEAAAMSAPAPQEPEPESESESAPEPPQGPTIESMLLEEFAPPPVPPDAVEPGVLEGLHEGVPPEVTIEAPDFVEDGAEAEAEAGNADAPVEEPVAQAEPEAEPVAVEAASEPEPEPAPEPPVVLPVYATTAPVAILPEREPEAAPEPVVDREPILAAVDRFNQRHKVVFDALRREVGAGARNVVVNCQRRLAVHGAVWETLVPDRNGLFERDALADALVAHWPADPDAPLHALIGKELELVRSVLDRASVGSLEETLAAM